MQTTHNDPKKIVVVGGVAGGMSFAARCRRLDPSADIVVFDRGRDVAFSNCSLPYHLSGIVEDSSSLVLMTPQRLRSQYNLDVRIRHEVLRINRDEQTVTVRDIVSGDEFDESYEVLALSPGASPILPPLPGADGDNVFTLRNVVDVEELHAFMQKAAVHDVVVVGGGYVGLEVAENLQLAGKKVTLVEMQPQVMMRLDDDLVQLIHRELLDQGVRVLLNDAVSEITDSTVTLASGDHVPAQAVVMAAGVRPEVGLARDAGLTIGTTGAIWVDHNFRTSDPAIYAFGDAVELSHLITRKPVKLALAGPAQRASRAAADHVYGRFNRRIGVIGSAVVQVFELTAASTGLTERECTAEGIIFDSIYAINSNKVGLMPDASPIHLKVLFEVPTGRILGAQAVGKDGVDKRIDLMATLIQMSGTLQDMADLELCYSPMHGTARDVLNHAGLVGLNQLHGEITQVQPDQVRELVEQDAVIIDVREVGEFRRGHIKGARNIPFSQFRSRLDEIPDDQPIYLHCRLGQRSYYMTRELNNLGWEQAVNINGAFLGLCNVEYFHDQTDGRESLVDKYNFN